MTLGYSWAYVSTSSDAILWDGSVCTSGGPWDSTTIYSEVTSAEVARLGAELRVRGLDPGFVVSTSGSG